MQNVEQLVDKFGPLGEFFLVGGCVRNQYLNLPIKDYDIATPLLPEELLAILPSSKLIEAAQAYPVVIWDGYEIATFRKDGKNRQDAEGIQVGASMYEDACRRDFTINAIYYRLTTQSARVYDPTEKGLSDIKQKLIRFVGDPDERIAEDPIRIFRGFRFLAQLPGFQLELETEKALKRSLLKVNVK